MLDKKTKSDIDSILRTEYILCSIEKYLDSKYPATADKTPRMIEMKDFEPGGWCEQHNARSKEHMEILDYLFGVKEMVR